MPLPPRRTTSRSDPDGCRTVDSLRPSAVPDQRDRIARSKSMSERCAASDTGPTSVPRHCIQTGNARPYVQLRKDNGHRPLSFFVPARKRGKRRQNENGYIAGTGSTIARIGSAGATGRTHRQEEVPVICGSDQRFLSSPDFRPHSAASSRRSPSNAKAKEACTAKHIRLKRRAPPHLRKTSRSDTESVAIRESRTVQARKNRTLQKVRLST